jgi:uncharacterized membrane protein YbhN (UPF0104 family)
VRSWRRAAIGALGVVIGGIFLWLALRHIDPGDLERALREMDAKWLIAGVAVYLGAIGLRCLRWGILLRAKEWVLLVGAAASILFGAALIFILLSQRIDLRRLGVMESIAARWDRLIEGIASVLRGHATIVALCSIGVWILEVLALASVVRSFGVSLSPPESLMLLGLASLSTLVPTAPGYVGTFQLVFAHVFGMFGFPQATGIIAATAVQIFCFGTVTILGGIVLLSRSGLTIWRARKWVSPERP